MCETLQSSVFTSSHALRPLPAGPRAYPQIFHESLKDRCVGPDGKRRLVLDVGANFGFFAVYAAKLGCRVIAWEPVPRFVAFARWTIAANNVSDLVDLRERVVSNEAGQKISMSAPTS